MTKALRVPDYLGHILKAIERIERHTSDVDVVGFLASELIQDAVIRNLEVIGEAANNIQNTDPVFAKAHDEIPWQVMYAMRNRLSHGYDKIDYDMVWKTVCNDLPELYALVKSANLG
ncbi:MAG: DUF86 domain-containing protein [Burkholderiales bacterium]|jgi:uncharacterized protein with HEPN domain|nr:DUF86 domain-containing protein [Burkholderiales bacterium]